jgi:hypothetical protein
MLADGRLGLRLDLVAHLGGEAQHADDAHRVFAVARLGVADHAQQPGLGVGHAAVVVDHDLRARVVVHRVDGEVAPRGVLDLRAPHVVAQHAAAGVHRVALAVELAARGLLVALDRGRLDRVVHVGAERGHLDLVLLAVAAVDHVHQAEAPAHDEGAPELRLHLLGRGVGGHVEVLRAQAHQQVAHGAADDVGLVARVLQRLDDAHRGFGHQLRIDLVLVDAVLDALALRNAVGRCVARRAPCPAVGR